MVFRHVTVIEERLLNLVQSPQNEDLLILRTTALCKLIDDILDESRSREDVGSNGVLRNEKHSITLLHTIFSVRSIVRMVSPLGHATFTECCGRIVVTISHLYPTSSLDTYWEFMERALSESNWERGVFHVSEMLVYLSLDAKSLSQLINKVWFVFQSKIPEKKTAAEYFPVMTALKTAASFSASHTSELDGDENSKADNSEKYSTLLITLSPHLRGCILRWICSRSDEYIGLFQVEKTEEEHMLLHSRGKKGEVDWSSHYSSGSSSSSGSRVCLPFDEIEYLLTKMEALATGITKRLFIWPTLVVFCCLLPVELRRAIDPSAKEGGVVDKVLRSTSVWLRPSVLQKTIDKHAQLFSELSVVSFLYLMVINAAIEMETKAPGFFQSYISPNLPKIRDMLLGGDMLSAPFLLKTSQLCKEHNIWLPPIHATIQKKLVRSFILSLGPEHADIFDSVLNVASQNIPKYLYIRSTVLTCAQVVFRSSNHTRPLLETSYMSLPSLISGSNVVQYIRQLIMIDLTHHSSIYRVQEDAMRDISNHICGQEENVYLKVCKLFKENVLGTTLTTSTSKRDSIPTLSYDETMIEYLEQYLSFLAEHFDALFPQQDGASLPNATGNVFFPTIIDAYICRTAVDLLSLYHTDNEIVRKAAERAFRSIFDCKNFAQNMSQSSFFGLVLYTLHRIMSTLWSEDHKPVESLLRATFTVLNTFNTIIDQNYVQVDRNESLLNVAYDILTVVEATLFTYLSNPNTEILSNVLNCYGEVGKCIEILGIRFCCNKHEDLGLIYEGI